MTLDDLTQLLREVCAECYEVAAPSNQQRYIVYTPYTETAIQGDDTVCLAVTKVQIDVYTQEMCDRLASDVRRALTDAGWNYMEVASGYDDEFAACRTILQTWVV